MKNENIHLKHKTMAVILNCLLLLEKETMSTKQNDKTSAKTTSAQLVIILDTIINPPRLWADKNGLNKITYDSGLYNNDNI